jgi:hypothetical protein
MMVAARAVSDANVATNSADCREDETGRLFAALDMTGSPL